MSNVIAAPVKRRKYVYPDRGAAEDAVARAQNRTSAYRSIATAGLGIGHPVEWVNAEWNGVDEYYRVGTIGHARGDGGTIFVVFYFPGQSASVDAYLAFQVRDVIAKMGYPSNDPSRALRDALYAAVVKCGY